MTKNDGAADRAAQAKADYDAAVERQSGQPTPTQSENDAAKLGFDSLKELDAKEDDGTSEPQAPPKGK